MHTTPVLSQNTPKQIKKSTNTSPLPATVQRSPRHGKNKHINRRPLSTHLFFFHFSFSSSFFFFLGEGRCRCFGPSLFARHALVQSRTTRKTRKKKKKKRAIEKAATPVLLVHGAEAEPPPPACLVYKHQHDTDTAWPNASSTKTQADRVYRRLHRVLLPV